MKKLKEISNAAPSGFKKDATNKQLKKLGKKFSDLQNLFFAEKKHSLLIILQGMDTSGKDGVIRKVFSSINPQGCNVRSFKTPTEEEKLHDFLWRIYPHLPESGMIQIFNRSHYEDIIFPVVHDLISKNEIKKRQETINAFEKHLQNNNTIILKFFLHISKDEQTIRLKSRLTNPNKRWKYNANDKIEAKKWDEYMKVYQTIIDESEKTNPWIVIPSNEKWYRDFLIAKVVTEKLDSLKMKYPV